MSNASLGGDLSYTDDRWSEWMASLSVFVVLAVLGVVAEFLPMVVGDPDPATLQLQLVGGILLLGGLSGATLIYRRMQAHLLDLVGEDYLTGVGNHRAFWEALGRNVALSQRTSAPLSLILLDLDNFKDVNDRHGHLAGDEVLRTVGTILQDNCRGGDLVFRYGGDEFAALCPDTAASGARELAKRMLKAIADPVVLSPPISASAGVAELLDRTSGSDLVDAADTALIKAKKAGGKGRIKLSRELAASKMLARAGSGIDAARRMAVDLAHATPEDGSAAVEHSENVERLSVLIGSRLGMEGDDLEKLRLAARVHDVGKVAIPAGVLAKRGALTQAEWSTIRSHPVVGESIVSAVPELEGVADLVRHTHERWDGCGYPDGLQASDIPYASRVIFACDSFQALRHERPYRSSLSTDDALQHMEKNAGSQFDPAVVEALVEVVCSGRPRGGNVSLVHSSTSPAG